MALLIPMKPDQPVLLSLKPLSYIVETYCAALYVLLHCNDSPINLRFSKVKFLLHHIFWHPNAGLTSNLD
jgi:hypothetical protein